MAAYTPPPPSLARDFVEAFFTLFVGTILQIGRFFRWIYLASRRSAARRELFQKAVAMGERMDQANAGDGLLRQQIRACDEPNYRQILLAQLGELGLEPGVPMLGIEEDYEAGHMAYRNCRQAEHDYEEAVYHLFPHSALGWFALLCSYVLTTAAVVLLLAFLFPNQIPLWRG